MLEITGLKTHLIGPIDLTLEPGECVALMGPSGSGKSLFLRAIADLDPTDGGIRLNGQGHDEMPGDVWRRHVALVPAESGWWADRVADHFPNHESIVTLLKTVALENALDWEVRRLSSGERQRLALVRALAGNPSVLLLDEPCAALDEAAAANVERLVGSRLDAGAMVVLVTHDRAQASRMAQRTIAFESGRFGDGFAP